MSKVVHLLLSALSIFPTLQVGRRRSWLGRGSKSGEAEIVPVANLSELDSVFTASEEGPVVLFLHDPYCPISARAHQRVREAGGEIHLVDVSRQHDLNRAVAERTRVRHESPQAFVLRDSKAVWYASHGGITTEGLAAARDR